MATKPLIKPPSQTPELEIICCGDSERNEWDAFVERSPDATLSHLYGWRRIITTAYGHQAFYVMIRRNEDVLGILPCIWIKSRLFGNTLVSMPFQDYGGIVANDTNIARLLLNQALKLRNDCGAGCLELRHRESVLESEGRLREDKATLLLDISSGSENLWKTLSSKVRNQVRKAEKSGLKTHLGGSELLEEFYRVFTVNMRDLGSPVHHQAFFSQVFSEFGDRARLLVVRDGERTVGGLIGIFFRDTIVVPWASSLREYFSKCPNNLLYWDAIQLACARGCRFFDFGRSSIGSGTYHFKTQWGAKPIKLCWQLFFRNEQSVRMPLSDDAKFKRASKLWSCMPLTLTVLLGPSIRKCLPN